MSKLNAVIEKNVTPKAKTKGEVVQSKVDPIEKVVDPNEEIVDPTDNVGPEPKETEQSGDVQEKSLIPKTILGFESIIRNANLLPKEFIRSLFVYIETNNVDDDVDFSRLFEEYLNSIEFFVTEKDRLKIEIEKKGWDCIEIRKIKDKDRYTAQVKQPMREKETIWIEHLGSNVYTYGVGSFEIGKIETANTNE